MKNYLPMLHQYLPILYKIIINWFIYKQQETIKYYEFIFLIE